MERELDAELRFHLDMQAAEYVRQGLRPEEARRRARQIFGGVDHVKADVRDTWLTRVVEACAQDVRYSLRSLRTQAGYAAAVVLTMALGIGANSAIFSVVNAVVLQPLPYARGGDLLLLKQPRAGLEDVGFAMADVDAIKSGAKTLDAVVEFHDMYFILLGGDEPARVSTGVVSWDYFDALGVTPLLGRGFRAEDDRHDRPATLLLGWEYWQRAFGGDPSVVGRVVQMNDRPHTVIGVLPNVPMYPQSNDVFMPRSSCPFRMGPGEAARRGSGMASVIVRRRPGVSFDEVQADLSAVARGLQREFPRDYPSALTPDFASAPLRREFSRSFESTLVVLLAACGFVLVIVCASVANLSVARAMRREHELTLRRSLGATRRRLLRQLVIESLLLATLGGAAGVFVAFVGMDLLVGYAERFTTRATEIRMDRPVLLFTTAIAILTGLAAGVAPACSRLVFARTDRSPQGPTPRSHRDLRRALIVTQVAAAVVLLVGAGLMLRSFLKLTAVDPGFNPDRVLTMQIDLNFTKHASSAARAAYLDRLLGRLREIPGAATVGAGGTIPFLDRTGQALRRFAVEGRDVSAARGQASLMVASEDYFHAMGVPLLEGRFFTIADNLDAPPVVIVNQALAERYWPGANPVGQRISGDGHEWHTIVGVVANVRQQLAIEPMAEIYAPLRRVPYVSTYWTIRATGDPHALMPLVREAVRSVDPDQPIHRLRPFNDVRAASLAPPRLTATLVSLFAALALLITAAGIAGVIAFSVTQRTHEFGLRVALGARRSVVLSMVLGEGVRLAASGLAIGMLGAFLLGALLSTILFGVGPIDVVTYAMVSSTVLAVAALACLLPALRAASIDPITALRRPGC
jgi:putative ABC transport system permease protein